MLELIAEFVRLVLMELFGALFHFLFYWPGWLLLRVITLGRYPPRAGGKHNRVAVSCFFIAAVALFAALYLEVGR